MLSSFTTIIREVDCDQGAVEVTGCIHLRAEKSSEKGPFPAKQTIKGDTNKTSGVGFVLFCVN